MHEPRAPSLPEALAARLWDEAAPDLVARPFPRAPVLAVLVGIPLSGKSTLARALASRATTATLHVENDAVREHVARALGHDAPTHEGVEHLLTYRTAWRLLALALRHGASALHDGTNLNEGARRGAYSAADAVGAPVVVVFVQTPAEVLQARAATLPGTRQRALAKLGGKRPNPAACSRLHVALDGAASVEANLARLREAPGLGALWGEGEGARFKGVKETL